MYLVPCTTGERSVYVSINLILAERRLFKNAIISLLYLQSFTVTAETVAHPAPPAPPATQNTASIFFPISEVVT